MGFPRREFYQRNVSFSFFINSKGPCLILTSNSKHSTVIPPISSACAWCLEEHSASTGTSRKSLKAIRVERPTQNTNWQARCASNGRPTAAPRPADHSPGSFMASSRQGCRLNKVSWLWPWHPQGPGQRVGTTKANSQLLKPEPACYLAAADLGP